MPDLIKELRGRWKVTTYGVAMPMNAVGDEKIISDSAGYNVMRGKEWGWFTIEQIDLETLKLNYDDERNHPTLRRVRDFITQIKPNEWLGTFYLGDCAVFDFSLNRVQ